jgi:hypothetical protein
MFLAVVRHENYVVTWKTDYIDDVVTDEKSWIKHVLNTLNSLELTVIIRHFYFNIMLSADWKCWYWSDNEVKCTCNVAKWNMIISIKHICSKVRYV